MTPPRYVLDTDTFSHYLRRHPRVLAAVLQYMPFGLALTIVTVEELWDGWQAAIRKARGPEAIAAGYAHLTDAITELRDWRILPPSPAALRRHDDLKRQKLNVGSNDMRIAAIALELGAAVATSNVRDFGRVPGLTVVDWATAPPPAG